MERLARSTTFWWVLLGIAGAVIVGTFVLEVLQGFNHVGGWFTIVGSACTVIVCALQLRNVSRQQASSSD